MSRLGHNKISTQNSELLHKEAMKTDNLQQIRQQLQANLMHFKHTNRQFINLIQSLGENPEQQKIMQRISGRAKDAISSLDNYQAQYKLKTNKDQQNLQIEQKIIQNVNNQIFQNSQSMTLQLVKNSLTSKLQFFTQEYEKIRQKIKCVNQQLNKPSSTQQLSAKLNIQLPEQVSQLEISMMQKYNFNELSLSCNQQIKKIMQEIGFLHLSIRSLKDKYYKIQLQLKEKSQIQKQLQKNENVNKNLNFQFEQLRKENEHLETNMNNQVQNLVTRKVQLMNADNYRHVKKYLNSCEYLLERFPTLLDGKQLEMMKIYVSNRMKQADTKNKNNSL